jgi:hypothetical protein
VTERVKKLVLSILRLEIHKSFISYGLV